MSQTLLPFNLEIPHKPLKQSSHIGLLLYLEMMHALGLDKIIDKHLHESNGTQGWLAQQIILSIILLNIAGGESVSDIEVLESDEVLASVIRKIETHGMSRAKRRRFEKRFRKGRTRTLPSESVILRFLGLFHNAAEEKNRIAGKALIPAPNKHLMGLSDVLSDFVTRVHQLRPHATATLDMDATLVESYKQSALHCYKHFKGYQPFNVWWDELSMVMQSEFRDGNVPAGYQQLKILAEALSRLPQGVKKVYMRSDSAGYEWELLKYCGEGQDPRFGKIEFAVSCDVNQSFKRAVAKVPEEEWQPLYRTVDGMRIDTGQQWCEVCYVPNKAGLSKRGGTYRFLALREPMKQLELPGVKDDRQSDLPFQTIDLGPSLQRYKLFGVVTNRDLPGDELIWWHRKRCGKSEEVHSIMKSDLAGGRMPSDLFGANAAWWGIMVIALNINSAFKQFALKGQWLKKRMKAIRFAIINVAGRLVSTARRLTVKLSGTKESMELMLDARKNMWELLHEPPG